MNARISALVCGVVAVLLHGCSQVPWQPAGPSVAEIAASFTNYQQVTKGVVLVNPELAMLCRGVAKADVDLSRKKHGPHANAGIIVYMNAPAVEAFKTNASTFPTGSVIVKQKMIHGYYGEDGRTRGAGAGVGGMVKRAAGYDSNHGDWEYFYFENPTKIESGRISSCIQCHEGARFKDYVFGTWSNRPEQ